MHISILMQIYQMNMKPVDIKDNTYIDFKKEANDKDPEIKVGDHD